MLGQQHLTALSPIPPWTADDFAAYIDPNGSEETYVERTTELIMAQMAIGIASDPDCAEFGH